MSTSPGQCSKHDGQDMLSGTREQRDTVGLWETLNGLIGDIDFV